MHPLSHVYKLLTLITFPCFPSCLKLYCQCFASSTTCGPKCRCGECHNTTAHASSIESARRAVLLRNPAAFQKAKMFQQQTHVQQQSMEHSLHMPPSAYQAQPRHRPPHPPQYLPARPVSQYPPPVTYSYTVPPTHYGQVMVPPNHPTSRSMGADAQYFSSHRPSHFPKQQRFSPQGPQMSPNIAPKVPCVVVERNAPNMISNTSFSHPTTSSMEGCKCRRSYCLKKYCECYQKSLYCTGICKCMNCYNFEGAPFYTMVDRVLLPFRPEPPVTTREPPTMMSGPPVTMMMPPVMSQPAIHRVSLGSSAGMMESVSAPPLQEGPPPAPEDDAMMQAAMAMTELLNGFASGKEEKDLPRPSESTDSSEDITSSEQLSEPNVKRPSFDSLESHGVTKKMKVTEDSTGFYSHQDTSPTKQVSAQLAEKPCVRDEAPPSRPLSATSVFHNRSLPTSRHQPSSIVEGHSNMYEEVTRLYGLPKSLSFRKICSKCGKTRSEHGENGFGNKCVYQQCGKCGTSAQHHAATGHIMGVLCQMSVREGAIAGAAANYERKIRELAKRAELQRCHQVRPLEEHTSAAPVILHPAATITSPRATTMAQ
jgi:Tesmin/TSO1-like CXC domain, cysteine-rich domain